MSAGTVFRHAVILTSLALPFVCAGQSASTMPEFEVASIKPADPQLNPVELRTPTLHAEQQRLRFSNAPLWELIALAYGVGKGQVTWPDEFDDSLRNRYDVLAKVPEHADKEQIPLMLQRLLNDRFGLKLSHENRVLAAYALELRGGALKLAEVTGGAAGASGCVRSRPPTRGISVGADCRNMTSGDIARALTLLAPGYFDRPVVDRTGLKGTYDFTLEWMTRVEAENGAAGPSLFDAVQNVGLKLNQKKEAMDVLVVSKVLSQPTEN
jgi:uncharacterized protein (TIGR03435 family)